MRLRKVAVVAALAMLAGCKSETKESEKVEAPAPVVEAPKPAGPAAPAGPRYLATLDPEQRQVFYHLSEGGELLPLDLLFAVDSPKTFKPFGENLERFGLLPDPADPDGLPVGMSVTTVDGKRSEPRMVFFNCAACHVNEITYQGKSVRVEGAPAHSDIAGLIAELIQSLDTAIASPDRYATILRRLAERRNPGGGESALAQAWPDLKLSADQGGAALVEQVSALIEKQKAHTSKELAMAKVKLETAEGVLAMIKDKLTYLKRLRGLRTTTTAGFGRLDAFMAARNLLFGDKYEVDVNSPVSLPPIFGLSKLTWYHYDNNTNSILQRNIGEDLGMGAVADTKTGASTVELRNILRLEQIAAKLPIPKWPESMLGPIDAARAGRGASIYKAECASCHEPDADGTFPDRTYDLATIGTDPNRAQNFAKPLGEKDFAKALGGVLDLVEKKGFEREGITAAEAAAMEPPKVVWRVTGKYASRPLGGVWSTAPYLHNGSVPTLYDLLLPVEQRPKTFLTGSREYDPKKVGFVTDGSSGATFLFDTALDANHNTGHTYGTALADEQRLDLIEYLKGL